jgi:hypothetical protein
MGLTAAVLSEAWGSIASTLTSSLVGGVGVFGSEAAIRQAVELRMRRYGGLREMMKREE